VAGLDLNSDADLDMQTLQHIPLWVFGLFIGLVALGLLQTRTRQVHKLQLLGAKVALTVVTLIGVVQLWWPTPWLAIALSSWAFTGLFVSWALSQSAAPTDASYNPATQRFTLRGSWLPLALFMAIFACKFVVGKDCHRARNHAQLASGHRHQRLVWVFVRHRDRSGLVFIETSMKEMT